MREQDWDVVVLDISLGERSGLEVLKELKQIRPRLPVLILSLHSGGQFARRALTAGASGVEVLRLIASGKTVSEIVKKHLGG